MQGSFFTVESHTADLQITVRANTLSQLFERSVIAMFQSMSPESSDCVERNGMIICERLPREQVIEIEASQVDILLVDFLSRALYLADVNNQAYLSADIHTCSYTRVHATVRGVDVDTFGTDIKAVTYHNLSVVQYDDGWRATIVFDI